MLSCPHKDGEHSPKHEVELNVKYVVILYMFYVHLLVHAINYN
jgi:hypothetical protein